MSEILNSYLERLAQALGMSNASAASRSNARPEAYHNSTSDQPSAYLDSGPVTSAPQAQTSGAEVSNDIALPPIKGLPGRFGHARTPRIEQATEGRAMEPVGQSRPTLEPQLKFGHDVFMNPIEMQAEAPEYKPETDPMKHGEDILSLLSEAEERSGVGKDRQSLSGHGTKEGAMMYNSPHAYGGRDMSEDEALEYLHFLGSNR